MYDLKKTLGYVEAVRNIAKLLNMQVIEIVYKNKRDLFNGFRKVYDVGPIEFMELINNASLVISSSFHGNVFSVIFKRPFFALDNENDYRIHNFLNNTNLSGRIITTSNYIEKIDNWEKIDFSYADKYIESEQKRAAQYLRHNLELE